MPEPQPDRPAVLSLCLVERLVGSVLLVLSGRELGLSVGQRRERIGMLGLSLIDGGVCRGRSSRGSVQLGLRVSRNLLLDGERLLSSLHLTLRSGHFLRGGCEFALALCLDRLGGLQRGSSGVHLCLGSLVLRACSTPLGSIQIGLGGSGLSASRIDRSLQVGDLLRLRHRARTALVTAALVNGESTAAGFPVASAPFAPCATAVSGDSSDPPVMAIVATATVAIRPAAFALPAAPPLMFLFTFLLIADSFPR